MVIESNQSNVQKQRPETATPAATPSADLLAAIVDSSDDAIISKDLCTRITSWNRAAEQMFGYSAAEAIDRPIAIIIPEDRLSEETTILAQITAGKRVEHFETERVRKDGTRLQVSLTISPIRDSSGEIVGASKIARDITPQKKEEGALRRSEHLLADFFENGGVGLHWVGPDGTILRVNRAELNLLGYSKDEYVGRHISEFHVDAPVIESIINRLQRGEKVDGQEARLRCKDGSIKHVLITSNTLWENGRLVHSRCFTRDITVRKEAEERARANYRELNDLKTALDEHAIVAVTDRKGKILYVNDKFCTISKYTREELIGQDHRIINSGYHSKEFIRGLWRTIRAGKTWKGELKNRARDGTFYWVDTTIVPYLDQEGSPTQFVAIRADITDRKLAEEQLRESEERFRSMADAAPVLIWMSGTDKQCHYFNKGWLDFVGRSLEEEIGSGWTENVHPDDLSRCLEIYSGAILARKPFEAEYRLRHHTGEYRWILDRAVPRFGPGGTFQGYIGGCIEIETQKRAEEKLEQEVAERTLHLRESVESLESVCYTMAHDLRAPLRAIHGYTKLLLDEYAPAFDKEGQHIAQRVVSGATRMDALINDLLEYVKLSHVRLIWQRVDLKETVQELLSEMSQEIEAKEAKILVGPLPTILAHPLLIEQVFANLLGNALKFVQPGTAPCIQIDSEIKGDWFRVWIQDNGIGIDPNYADNVFEVFHRLHHNEAVYPGTGVGLAIVRKAMDRMGGRVEVAAEVVEGTRFNIDFPASRSS